MLKSQYFATCPAGWPLNSPPGVLAGLGWLGPLLECWLGWLDLLGPRDSRQGWGRRLHPSVNLFNVAKKLKNVKKLLFEGPGSPEMLKKVNILLPPLLAGPATPLLEC